MIFSLGKSLNTRDCRSGGALPYQWNRNRGMPAREGLEPFGEAARKVYWDMRTSL